MPIDISNFSKPEVDPASVVGGVGGPSVLTGVGADDVFALSAGTGQKLALSGVSPSASVSSADHVSALIFGPGGVNAPDGTYTLLNTTTKKVGDGTGTTLAAVYANIAAAQVKYPFAISLTQTVDFCALMLGLDTAIGLETLYIPHGFYIMGDPNTARWAFLRFPGTNVPMTVRGDCGGFGQPDAGGSSTRIVWNADMVNGSDPHLFFAADFTAADAMTIRNIAFLGPNVFPFNSGRLPCRLAGIRTQGSALYENVSLEFFSSGAGMGGSTAFGFPNNKGFDHSRMKSIWMNNVGFGVHLLPGSNTAGDQRFYDMQIHANCASYAIAGSASSGLVGSLLSGAGTYSPIGQYLYDDDSHAGAQILGNVYEEASHELSYNGAVVCQRLQNPGGGIFAKNVMNYFFQGPHTALAGWMSPSAFTCTASTFGTGSPNQVTITANNGEYWQLGMAVTGTGIPAGATVTAVNGFVVNRDVQNNWPYTNPTLTLSVNLTADPTGSGLGIVMPKLGNIVAFSIHDNVASAFSQGYPPYPAFYTPAAGQINDNACADVNQTLNAAQTNAQTSGPTYGTTWGQPGGSCLLGSGIMQSGVGCTAGDLLQYDTGGKKLKLFDGTSFPVGLAVLTTATGGNVDFYMSGVFPNYAVASNKSGSTILANSLVAGDTTNHGGIKSAVPGDLWIVGILGNTPLTTGNSAALAQFKP